MALPHNDLIRIFIPIIGSLQLLGTIEAGYRLESHATIHPLLQATLERWVAAEVARTIESALLLERQQQYAIGLATLHELSYELQTDLKLRPPSTWLRKIVDAGRTVLSANLVLLYLWDSDSSLSDRRRAFAVRYSCRWCWTQPRGEDSLH